VRFSAHEQREAWIPRCVSGQEIQEIPLRHEGDELAARRQMREIGHGDLG
jgi:hypothetical protein